MNKTADRPEVRFQPKTAPAMPVAPKAPQPSVAKPAGSGKQDSFFRTMTAAEFKAFSTLMEDAPKPAPAAAVAVAAKVERQSPAPVREVVQLPAAQPSLAEIPTLPVQQHIDPVLPPVPETEQQVLSMPTPSPWRMVGELYNTYIIVEQGEEAFLIDKHAAHERILFEKLKSNQERISSQTLISPIPCHVSPDEASALLSSRNLLLELGFEAEEFGDHTILLRQVPMDLSPEDAADALISLAADLMNGRQQRRDTVRDELLHTVACKAAIKAGWHTDEKELLALVTKVMADDSLKYCPHGRPICITLSKKQLEKQFKRS